MTEDVLLRRPDLGTTTNPDDMLSLPDPDEYGLPEPPGNAPPSSLAAPIIATSYSRPPMDHRGVLTSGKDVHNRTPVFLPHCIMPEDDLITCSNIEIPVTPTTRRMATGNDAMATGSHDDAIEICDSDFEDEEDVQSKQCQWFRRQSLGCGITPCVHVLLRTAFTVQTFLR